MSIRTKTALLPTLAAACTAAMAAQEPAAPASETAAATPAAESPSGLTWGQVWGILAGLGGVGGASYLAGRRTVARIEPQPLAVDMQDKYATRDEVAALAERLVRFETETRELIRSSEQRSHGRMDLISSKLDRLIGLVEGLQSLDRHDHH